MLISLKFLVFFCFVSNAAMTSSSSYGLTKLWYVIHAHIALSWISYAKFDRVTHVLWKALTYTEA